MNTSMTVLDHLFTLVLCFGFTGWAIWSYRRIRPALERGEPGERVRAYRQDMVAEWGLAVAVLALWLWAARPWTELGLGFTTGWGQFAGAALAVIVLVGLSVQTRMLASDAEARDGAASQMGEFRCFLPHTRGELRTFLALSVTAGICEELLYRGYLMWYLDLLGGPVVAVVGSSVIFGLGHAGYGGSTAARAGILGLVFAGLYLLTGALWVPMIVHTCVDMAAGAAGWLVHREPAGTPARAGS